MEGAPNSGRRESVAPRSDEGTEFIDLHISTLPKQFWNSSINCAPYQSLGDAITIGFIRCHIQSSVCALRETIESQLGDDKHLPRSYTFLKGVGRALVPIRPMQETMLTIENFKHIGSRLPPEICLLDKSLLTNKEKSGGATTSGGNKRLLTKRNKVSEESILEKSAFDNSPDNSAQELRNRVNKNVHERMVARTKKKNTPTPKIQQDPDMEKSNTIDSIPTKQHKGKELFRANIKKPSARTTKNSVRFPKIGSNDVVEYDSDVLPRHYPIQESNLPKKSVLRDSQSHNIRASMVNNNSFQQGGGGSSSSEQESAGRRETMKRYGGPKYSSPTSITKQSIDMTSPSDNVKSSMTPKSKRKNSIRKSLSKVPMKNTPSPKKSVRKKDSENKTSRYKSPRKMSIASSEDTTDMSYLSNDVGYVTNTEAELEQPQKVESHEDFYRRKSVDERYDKHNTNQWRCPDCGLPFKTDIDKKRHFNLIHRQTQAQIKARQALQKQRNTKYKKSPSRWGPQHSNMK